MAAQGTSPIFRCAQRGHYCKGMDLVADTYSAPLLECRHTLNPDLLDPRMVHERVSKLQSAPHGVFVAVMAGWPVDPSAATYRLSRGGPGQTLQLDPDLLRSRGCRRPGPASEVLRQPVRGTWHPRERLRRRLHARPLTDCRTGGRRSAERGAWSGVRDKRRVTDAGGRLFKNRAA